MIVAGIRAPEGIRLARVKRPRGRLEEESPVVVAAAAAAARPGGICSGLKGLAVAD